MTSINIPRRWEQLTVARLEGTLLVVGEPDVGKSTFAQYLYKRLCAEARCVAYLDGDPGQSTLGLPTTITLAVGVNGDDTFPPKGQSWQSFVGAVSPRGHMLPLLVGVSRLVQVAREAGAETIIYDTSGLVDPAKGGTSLKLAKVDLLQPTAMFAIQRTHELESLLVPLRRSRRVRVVDLRSSPARQRRDVPTRQAHRASRFAQYFATARPLTVEWGRLAVFPSLRFVPNQLVALEDACGFTLGLGIVRESNPRARQVTLQTPLESIDGVDALRLGDVLLNPETFRDQRLGEKQPQITRSSQTIR